MQTDYFTRRNVDREKKMLRVLIREALVRFIVVDGDGVILRLFQSFCCIRLKVR